MSGIELTATSAGQEENRKQLDGVNVQTARVHVGNSKYDEIVPDEYVNVTVGIFFDGTLNNKSNTDARLAYEKKVDGKAFDKEKADAYKKWYTFKKSGSYDNSYSNIARMEKPYKKINSEKEFQLAIYMEGIGTEDYEDDQAIGKGLGRGSTGVIQKVKKGCKKIVDEGIAPLNLTKKINKLQIDAFGFSRGAAAARNFVYEVSKRKGQFKKKVARGRRQTNYSVDHGALGEALASKGIEVKIVVIRFIGLYDTVASVGFAWEHKKNTATLHLRAVRKALHTLQLAASDEHRSNFMLTSIASAGGRGKEKYLPGVHSDIGGGYTDGVNEKITLDSTTIFGVPEMYREKERLIEQGWFNEGEIDVSLWDYTLNGNRKGLSNKYSHIPLHIMVEYAVKKNVLFSEGQVKNTYSIEGDTLLKTKKRLDAYVDDLALAMDFEQEADKKLLKVLRNKYFHFSAHLDDKVLGVIAPHKPNFINGKRKRETNPG